MKVLRTEVDINASAERVWAILSDFSSYGRWNPAIPCARGKAAAGAQLEICICLPGGLRHRLRVRMLHSLPGRRLAWEGHLLAPWLLRGEHSFTLENHGSSAVRVRQEERFTGVLVPLLMPWLEAHVLPGFLQATAGLKRLAES